MTSQNPSGTGYRFGRQAAPPRDPFKEMVIDAICGAGFTTANQAVRFERMRLARLADPAANAPADRWLWQRGQLAGHEIGQLQEIYQELKEIQWAQERDYAAKAVVTMLKAQGPVSELPQ